MNADANYGGSSGGTRKRRAPPMHGLPPLMKLMVRWHNEGDWEEPPSLSINRYRLGKAFSAALPVPIGTPIPSPTEPFPRPPQEYTRVVGRAAPDGAGTE